MGKPLGWKAWLRSPALWGSLACCFCTLSIAHRVMLATGGLFVYPLDDSYIHLALARTLATFHVWGINPSEFGSASSSPAWTLLLAGSDLLFGSHLLTPVILNLLLVFGLLYFTDASLRVFAPRISLAARYAIVLALVIATPLPDIVILGMEHVAQTLSILLVVVLAIRILELEPSVNVRRSTVVFLLLSTMFAGAIRYEAVFIVVPVSVLLVLRRRVGLACIFALCSAVGPLSFGLYSHHVSGFWLPFSVTAKADFDKVPFSIRLALGRMFVGRHSSSPVFLPLFVLWIMRLKLRRFWDPIALLLLLSAFVAAVHTLFAPIGWLMRYESYFVFLGLFAILTTLVSTPFSTWSWSSFRRMSAPDVALQLLLVLGLLILVAKLSQRSVWGMTQPVEASVDRYHEHIPMADFIRDHYNHATVVVNDIGAIGYNSDAHLLDMAGLASARPLQDSRHGLTFTKDDMAQWATEQNASIAVLQLRWPVIQRRTPPTWQLVQIWRIPRNIVFPDFEIGFYAVQPDARALLCKNLSMETLPEGDVITYNRCNPTLTQ